jgi:lysozyme family protein
MERPLNLPASNHFPSQDFNLLKTEYEYLFSICTINPNKQNEVDRVCEKIIENKARYLTIQNRTGVPWYFVAVIHLREASFNFKTYLGNGDPLNKPSVHEPKNRGPFATWEDGAIDALQNEGFANKNDWSLGMIFKRLEWYNGSGYRYVDGKMTGTTPLNASPYIYNYTPFYTKGGSVEDHSFYPNWVDDNAGCMAVLKQLEILGEFNNNLAPAVVNLQDEVDNKDKALELADGLNQKNALEKLFNKYPISKANFWAVVDFNLSSSVERLFIFNLQGKSVKKFLVSHGSGSGYGFATTFSNVNGSHCSSLGIYKTLETYIGIHGESLRIKGLESTNSNAAERYIVIHSAEYVVGNYNGLGRAGRSEGCFAVNPNDINEVINCLKDGSYLIAWHD